MSLDNPPRHPMRLLRQTAPDRVVIHDDDREMCIVCGELPASEGIYCKRCARGLDDDRYERECGR